MDQQSITASFIEGCLTKDHEAPSLIGSRCMACGTYYFPPQTLLCRNQKCDCDQLEKVPLSRIGKLWSYTNCCQAPPEPYVVVGEFKPFAIAAVELAQEKMIILGQVVADVEVSQLKIGMMMELAVEAICQSALVQQRIWKWRPVVDES